MPNKCFQPTGLASLGWRLKHGVERLLLGVACDWFGALCKAPHSDPYAQVETMRRCREIDRAGPYSAECSRPARSAHSL